MERRFKLFAISGGGEVSGPPPPPLVGGKAVCEEELAEAEFDGHCEAGKVGGEEIGVV